MENAEREVNSMLSIVADRWSTLRGCDVYRLLDQFDLEDQNAIGDVIKRKRPDLKRHVDEALTDLEGEAHQA